MVTSRENISKWFDIALQKGATHLLIVRDTFNDDEFPEYIMPNQDVHACYRFHNGPNMEKVLEVYKMSLPKEDQLNEDRAFHF